MEESLTFPLKLETENNLWPAIARQNSLAMGLPHAAIDANELQLKALVARRNEIAHGKRLVIRRVEEYQRYEEAALVTMHELAVGIIESLEDKKYLKV